MADAIASERGPQRAHAEGHGAAALYTDPGGLWATIRGWITTVDHKRIGIMYASAALFFLLVGGLEALLIRVQLAVPENDFIGAETYNQLFTMHGTTMIFLVAMPLAVAFFNYIVPLQIGARDVAFPRLNALSFWVFLFGGLFLNSSWLFGAAPNTSWVGYANLTSVQYSPGLNVDFWVIGLSIVGISSLIGAINFITTIINLRAPGLTLMRMPLFTWMTFVTSWILATAIPVIAVALIFLAADRFFATNFFVPGAGGDPVLWQHLFWIFGHPEVYILILPSFGIISEVVPTFSRKPLFGYPIVVYAGILIGFIGWGVWSHHMFTTGLGPIADSFFVASTMIIAIPTGVKIFNWLATMWGGALRFTTAMLFAIGLVAIFTIGGLSGIMHASAPVDLQQHDSYFVVAHFHYTIVGGAVTGLFAGFYYWYPKVTGRLMSETLGKWHFWTFIVGFNLTFFPQHFVGLFGMPRRVFTYPAELGLGGWNMASTIGAFIFGVSTLIFVWNLIRSARRGTPAAANPWDAPTLEWSVPSPPPHYNFAEIPEVESRDPLWKGAAAGPDRAVATGGDEPHMPSPSAWPILTALGISLTWILLMARIWWVPLIGLAVTAVCVYSWAFQPAFRAES
ncbi:MAG: cytochrome c oxidase subunit I [Gemmatimonadetes bacterium]|uniref:Cytochrome c oxidase subunit 1 n=1 Tax=Candidatus Kutchimonas denitrificans TaxID=3056748 RepID=A0AAE4ZAW7_9BACT|nr:cytochrome c oxidase subunit I [Gemmatimonadota bacterium]NIR76273.1 cytochrome c oxidase subunit I [Candidatus Kutchimonas denitrificans]NIS02296.1 cytochrome c oxidase subunit I [Gemmatimonadota bacterium]NIT68115.1 cytochrome c oxidase subunit I [Gemmatimonadota bacterium]NIU54339.1 cytochrome c oxidase subunit I [Gemmatimonadota bacterium]